MVDNVNSTRGFYDVWIPIAPALVLGLAAIRPRSLGLTAVGFAAPLYAIGVQLDMNVRDGITFAVLACGATVLVAASARSSSGASERVRPCPSASLRWVCSARPDTLRSSCG